MSIKFLAISVLVFLSSNVSSGSFVNYLGCQILVENMEKFEQNDGKIFYFRLDEKGNAQSITFASESVIDSYMDVNEVANEYVSNIKKYEFEERYGYSLIFNDGVEEEEMFLVYQLLEKKSITFLGFEGHQINNMFMDCEINFP